MGVLSNLRTMGSEPSGPSARLTSWKEIAAYLNRDPRTVQLWEKNEGLPVHRINHQSRSSVYAYPSEIDAWLETRSGRTLLEIAEVEQATADAPPVRRLSWVLFIGIVVVLIVAAALVAAWQWYKSHQTNLSPATVAVLPFESQTSGDDLLAEGLTDDLITELGLTGQIAVISRRSVQGYKGRHVPPAQIARELHATLILRGTIAQLADRVDVTVELVDALGAKHLWGKTYEFRTRDAIAGEDHIASMLARAVSEQITGTSPITKNPPKSSDARAVEAYLAGRYFWDQRGTDNLRQAIASFNQAIAFDPKFAAAYAGLADCYDLMTDRGVMPSEKAFELAKKNARAALDRDPNSAEAYNALAFATYRQDWDFTSAESYFKKAIQLNPNDSVAHQWYGEFLGDLRRFDESIAELQKAIELNPLSPMAGTDLADGFLHAGRLAEAEAALKRVLEMYPKFVPAYLGLTSVYLAMPNLPAAEAELQVYEKLTGDREPSRALHVRQLVAAGKLDEARRQVRLMSVDRKVSPADPYRMAQLYFLTAQEDAGYAALEGAFRQHSCWLVTMLVDPGFKSVRSQPRFLNLAHRVGLPTTAQPGVHRGTAAPIKAGAETQVG